MKNGNFLKVLGTSLFILITLFFMVNNTLAQEVWIEFDDIDQIAEDAQYLQWEIKASRYYQVTVYLEDDDGDNFRVVFRTEDGNDEADSDYHYVVKIGEDYTDSSPSKETYEADLDSLINDDWGEYSYTAGDNDAKIKKIRIHGNDFYLYSITLADNENFDNPCWLIDVSEADWEDNDDFKDDGGNFSSLVNISYNSSNIHVENPSSGGYPYGGFPGYLQWTNPYFGLPVNPGNRVNPVAPDRNVPFAPDYPYFQQQGFYPYGSGYPYSGFPNYLQWTNPWPAYNPPYLHHDGPLWPIIWPGSHYDTVIRNGYPTFNNPFL